MVRTQVRRACQNVSTVLRPNIGIMPSALPGGEARDMNLAARGECACSGRIQTSMSRCKHMMPSRRRSELLGNARKSNERLVITSTQLAVHSRTAGQSECRTNAHAFSSRLADRGAREHILERDGMGQVRSGTFSR